MSVDNKHIGGDASVGRNATMGGDARVRGSVHIGHNLRVDGWIEGKDIKAANKGLFLNESELNKAYPNPHDGWFAGVGSSSPFIVYIARDGEWVRTTGTFSVDMDMSQYNGRIEALEGQLESNNALIAELIEIIREGGGSADYVMITLETNNTPGNTMGSVSGGGLKQNGSVTVTATAESGYHFVEWQDAEGNTIAGAGATYTFEATESVTLKAVFAVSYYTVTVGTDQTTLGDVSKTQSEATGGYIYNEEVTLTATPKQTVATAYFVRWEDAQGVVKSTSASYTFKVTENVTLKAVFDEERLITTEVVLEEGDTDPRGGTTIRIKRGGSDVSGNRVRIGDRVTLTATGTSYKPSAWTDVNGAALGEDFTIESSGDTMTCTFTYTGTQTLSFKAKFEGDAIVVTHRVSVIIGTEQTRWGSVTIDGENKDHADVNEGGAVTLNAIPAPGFKFVRWLLGNDQVSTVASYAVTNISEDRTYKAVFATDVYYGEIPASITEFSSKTEAVISAITPGHVAAAISGNYMTQAANLPIPESSPVTVTTTGAKSYMLAIVPENSDYEVKQFDGISNYVEFDESENHYANGEVKLAINGTTYKVFGQYASTTGDEFTIVIEKK